jgi:hypothetical protein
MWPYTYAARALQELKLAQQINAVDQVQYLDVLNGSDNAAEPARHTSHAPAPKKQGHIFAESKNAALLT